MRWKSLEKSVTKERRKVSAKGYYELILREGLAAWVDAGHETEAFAPTLASALLEEPEFSKTSLLNGNLDNLQPLLEYIGVLESGDPPPVGEVATVTTLDKACKAVDVSSLDAVLARITAFCSPRSKDEANAIVLSLYAQEILGLKFGCPKHIDVQTNKASKRLQVKKYRRVQKALNKLMEEDSADFLIVLSRQRIGEINFCCYKGIVRIDLFSDCIIFWKSYCDWRQENAEKISFKTVWKTLRRREKK